MSSDANHAAVAGEDLVEVAYVSERSDERVADYLDLIDSAARAERERDELFVAEGPIALQKLLRSGHRIRSVLTTPKFLPRVKRLVAEHTPTQSSGSYDMISVLVTSPELMRETVGFNLHRGIVAAADRRPLPTLSDLLDTLRPSTRIAVLEGLNDPENLGLVARAARAFGIEAFVLDPTCIDPYYRRTVRVSMGEILLLPCARAESWPDHLTLLHEAGFETWALTPGGDQPLWSLTQTMASRVALMLGAEGPGLQAATIELASRRVTIPIDPAVDSVNVSHAAAIAFSATSAAAVAGRFC